MSELLGEHNTAYLRLAFNFATETERRNLQCAIALRDKVIGTTRISEERMVCATQLAWWCDEMTRMLQGEARHPLSKAFADAIEIDSFAGDLVNEWCICADRMLRAISPDSANQWRIMAFRLHATPLILSCEDAGQRRGVVDGFRDCAVAMMTLDSTGSGDDLDSVLAELNQALASHVQDSDYVALSVLASQLSAAIAARQRASAPPVGLSALFGAWRTARACRKRIQRRP